MAEAKISQRERQCIAECIYKHWRDDSRAEAQQRSDAYEQCLTDCNLCA